MAIVDLQSWGNWAAIPVWMLTTFFGYWAHRTMHYFDILWRAGHQLHHGVARVDISSAMIFHPVDIGIQGVLSGLLAAGLSHSTAHARRWGGLLGLRRRALPALERQDARLDRLDHPAARSALLHHERDVHARNFGDMPIWDRLFGTYGKPGDRSGNIGLRARARSRRWIAMLAMVDVNRTEHVDGRIRL